MICTDELQTLELTAWDFDTDVRSVQSLPEHDGPVVLQAETDRLAPLFASLLQRHDLQQEFAGLMWRMAVVDLRTLQAFQRRLVFDAVHPAAPDPRADDWNALTALAFGPPRSTTHTYVDSATIQSENPDLHVRFTEDGWQLHGGSPFLEVALYQGRAFLRDGYHRAYTLLSAGIHAVPAVVIEAHSLEEVCFESPNFFPESILSMQRPPMVTDFLDRSLTIMDSTPRVLKTIHLPTELEHAKEYHP